MSRRTVYGWKGKTYPIQLVVTDDGWLGIKIIGAFAARGKRNEWLPEDWPPEKVKITLESPGRTK